MDRRVAGVLGAVAAVILVGSGASLYASRHTPPPVLITDADTHKTPPVIQEMLSVPPPTSVSTTVTQVPSGGVVPAAPPVSPSSTPNQPQPQTASMGLYVHVAGAVKRPDLYVLPPGSRVYNAIKAAGGAASNADQDAVNLAEPLTDGEKVYVPRKNENAQPPGAGNSLGHASTATSAPAMEMTARHESHGRTRGGAGKLTDPSEGTVDINTATAEQIERLPGIGPAMADRILDYRTHNGKFRTLDDLREVGGIGDKKLARLAPFVRL